MIGWVVIGLLAAPPTPLRVEHPAAYWTANGFVPLAPPVHLPEGLAGRTRTVVWLKLPPDAVVRTARDARGRPSLRFPPGTVADRVESWRPRPDAPYRVADVRGTRIAADGAQIFRAMRPERPGVGAALFGFEWRRDDAAAGEAVVEAVQAALRRGAGSAWPLPPARREAAAARYRRLADCGGCHTPDRPDSARARTASGVRRGTDGSGFYVPRTVLADAAPLEAYRPYDPNADDPCVRVRCGVADASRWARPNGAVGFRCADGSAPRGTLDLACAERAARPHAAAVCASRRVLYDHLDAAGRRAYAPAFRACGLEPTEEDLR
ncbi:MAG: hypothetical protein H6704_06880 [Myxococcales bacterium]|nr:hypothetical protein [Myxococcales bacterium]